jgi:hypothetical protein
MANKSIGEIECDDCGKTIIAKGHPEGWMKSGRSHWFCSECANKRDETVIMKPFTPDQVEWLNRFQNDGRFHPFTCGCDGCRSVLVATEEGWVCPDCDYTQDWAHGFMAQERPER